MMQSTESVTKPRTTSVGSDSSANYHKTNQNPHSKPNHHKKRYNHNSTYQNPNAIKKRNGQNQIKTNNNNNNNNGSTEDLQNKEPNSKLNQPQENESNVAAANDVTNNNSATVDNVPNKKLQPPKAIYSVECLQRLGAQQGANHQNKMMAQYVNHQSANYMRAQRNEATLNGCHTGPPHKTKNNYGNQNGDQNRYDHKPHATNNPTQSRRPMGSTRTHSTSSTSPPLSSMSSSSSTYSTHSNSNGNGSWRGSRQYVNSSSIYNVFQNNGNYPGQTAANHQHHYSPQTQASNYSNYNAMQGNMRNRNGHPSKKSWHSNYYRNKKHGQYSNNHNNNNNNNQGNNGHKVNDQEYNPPNGKIVKSFADETSSQTTNNTNDCQNSNSQDASKAQTSVKLYNKFTSNDNTTPRTGRPHTLLEGPKSSKDSRMVNKTGPIHSLPIRKATVFIRKNSMTSDEEQSTSSNTSATFQPKLYNGLNGSVTTPPPSPSPTSMSPTSVPANCPVAGMPRNQEYCANSDDPAASVNEQETFTIKYPQPLSENFYLPPASNLNNLLSMSTESNILNLQLQHFYQNTYPPAFTYDRRYCDFPVQLNANSQPFGDVQQQVTPRFNFNRQIFPNSKKYTHPVKNFKNNRDNTSDPPFWNRAHLIETKKTPDKLCNGSKWDSMSKNIWNKFISSQQTGDTYKRKLYLWFLIYNNLKKAKGYEYLGKCSIYVVGSTITGFGLDTSDVDMCLVSRRGPSYLSYERQEVVQQLSMFKKFLQDTSGIFDRFNLIEAKVPILRFVDTLHKLDVDINFNNSVGIRNTHLLQCYSQMDWRLRPLCLVTKLWAQFHDINNAKNMTISSYSLVLMVINYLQYGTTPSVLPCLHDLYPEKFKRLIDISSIDMTEVLPPYESENIQTLGELFMGFLEHYSTFDYGRYAISVRTAGVLPVEQCRLVQTPKNEAHTWVNLCVEEPFDYTNTARSCYDAGIFEQIKSVFLMSWNKLRETMDINQLFDRPFMANPPRTLYNTNYNYVRSFPTSSSSPYYAS